MGVPRYDLSDGLKFINKLNAPTAEINGSSLRFSHFERFGVRKEPYLHRHLRTHLSVLVPSAGLSVGATSELHLMRRGALHSLAARSH